VAVQDVVSRYRNALRELAKLRSRLSGCCARPCWRCTISSSPSLARQRVRDKGLLDSALPPQNLFTNERSPLFDLAASLAFGLIKNDPFVDSNKRVAFIATITFFI
jgi:hypothetical protein